MWSLASLPVRVVREPGKPYDAARMNPTSLKCPECGGKLLGEQLTGCQYCGARLAVSLKALPAEESPAVQAGRSVAERVALVERSTEMARAQQVEPSAGGEVAKHGIAALVGVIVAVFGIGFVVAMSSSFQGSPGLMIPGGGRFDLGVSSGPPWMFYIVPLVFVAIGIGVVVRSISQASVLQSAPLERLPAVVVEKRTEVSGGASNARASTTYHTTLELKGGARRELRTPERLAGLIKTEDSGIAFVKAGLLLEFQRVEIAG